MHRAPIPHQLDRINSTDSRGSIVFTTTLPFATSTHLHANLRSLAPVRRVMVIPHQHVRPRPVSRRTSIPFAWNEIKSSGTTPPVAALFPVATCSKNFRRYP